MTGKSRVVRVAIAAVASFAAFAVFQPYAEAAVTKVEAGCASGLGKSGLKAGKTAVKETAKCREADISGKAPGACPNAGNLAKIAKAQDGIIGAAEKSCKSVCSVSSTVECITSTLCPPLVSGASEQCSAGVKNRPFDMRNIGFPGPYCLTTLGQALTEPANIGQCVGDLTVDTAAALVDVIYGSLSNASGISPDALGCLKAISKGAQKLTATVASGVEKCRNAINGGAPGDPANCQTSDPKIVDKINKAAAKLDTGIDAKCSPAAILELDLCGNGVGQTLTIADAKTCLKAAAREIADSSDVPALRTYAPVSLVDAAYPPRETCGDNVVNQVPNALLLLGEECDGTDDSACLGECLPPGDVFECTCGSTPRVRLMNNASLTDSDAGWTGESHQQGVADLSGHVTSLSNCNCDAFTGATCTGTTSDPVCDSDGPGLPTCSWDLFSATRCDAHGNVNNVDEDKDCAICDQFSANAGAFCIDAGDCDAQCYDTAGVPTGPCNSQTDCASGEVCRGQCDIGQSCYIVANGAPLPVAAASAAVCAVQRLRTDVSGTRNMVTGEHEINYQLYSMIFLGDRTTRPCPTCGGFCEGGDNDLNLCQGRCSTTSTTACRFDADCPGGESCSPQSPDCPGATAFCQLELVCGTDRNYTGYNQPCSIEYEHAVFGSMSNDCLPQGVNITNLGFQVDHLPDTSGTVSLSSGRPCSAPGFSNYDCACGACQGDSARGCSTNADCTTGPCVGTLGAASKPNGCAPACNAVGPDFGVGCATGNTSGQGTTCTGGTEGGALCDEDSDCDGGTCSNNPEHCIGDPAFAQFACTINADCGVGTCGDACSGGRCVPLCVPTGDPLQGLCAAGPEIPHCTGGFYVGKGCPVTAANAGCSATCSVSGDPCTTDADCPPGENCAGTCPHAAECEAGDNGIIGDSDDNVGAGACEFFARSCFLEPIVGDGGSTLDGEGDPDNDANAVIWCFGATTNVSVNTTSGFPGPGRVLSRGTNVTNGFTSIP